MMQSMPVLPASHIHTILSFATHVCIYVSREVGSIIIKDLCLENAGLDYNITRWPSFRNKIKRPLLDADSPPIFYCPRMLVRIVMVLAVIQVWAMVVGYLIAFFLV